MDIFRPGASKGVVATCSAASPGDDAFDWKTVFDREAIVGLMYLQMQVEAQIKDGAKPTRDEACPISRTEVTASHHYQSMASAARYE